MDNSRSLMPVIALGVLETAINAVICSNEALMVMLSDYTGKVIRVKLTEPDFSMYFIFCADGVQVLSQFDGRVDARVRGPALFFIMHLLAPVPEPLECSIGQALVVSGDQELVVTLNRLFDEFNVWHMLHQMLLNWIPEPFSFTELIDALHRADPVWIDKLQAVLQSLEGVRQQLSLQTDLQRQQLQESMQTRRLLMIQHKRMQCISLMGVLVFLVGALNVRGVISLQAMFSVMGSLNVALMLGGAAIALLGLLHFILPDQKGMACVTAHEKRE